MRRRGWNFIMLLLIIAITAGSLIVIWPSEPDRYLPSAIPWPVGRGVKIKAPNVEGGTFGLKTLERRAMSLGLDLRGGTRLVLEPEQGVQVEDLGAALDGARDVIERRVNEFGVAEAEVNKLGNDRLSVQIPGIGAQEAIARIGRTALLQFCRPLEDSGGNVAIVRTGTVKYDAQTCQPTLDQQGNVVIEGGGQLEYSPWPSTTAEDLRSLLVWTPATAEIDGKELPLDGHVLRPNTSVSFNQVTNEPLLVFQWTSAGSKVSEVVTKELSDRKLPLAPFLDGQPITGDNGQIIAPIVQGPITGEGQIDGLSTGEARDLSKLLNTGAFPIPLRIVQQQDVDATLGSNAVRDSVIAGEVALLLIMAFMIIYYRLPGVIASLALVVYTSVVLAIFKLWPVTLTLSGVAAFVLSLGMAVDANILIFERMKEELRVGRNLVTALEDGFTRAWSSIRDSNISTLITCAILYWFGNQFGESAIKGFAITLAVGVLISLFSAITVTRTFMLFVINIRPLARRLWLFAPDLPPHDARQDMRRVPAIAGGSDSDPAPRRGGR